MAKTILLATTIATIAVMLTLAGTTPMLSDGLKPNHEPSPACDKVREKIADGTIPPDVGAELLERLNCNLEAHAH